MTGGRIVRLDVSIGHLAQPILRGKRPSTDAATGFELRRHRAVPTVHGAIVLDFVEHVDSSYLFSSDLYAPILARLSTKSASSRSLASAICGIRVGDLR
jgi:hypothetical protein